jgi:Arc/MetJ-type ribon-helix-helix transcriptional regulator
MKTSEMKRITVTLPNTVVKEIDRLENNRSRFVADAVRHEVELRRRTELKRSLDNPHPDSLATAELGFDSWVRELPAEDTNSLVDGAGLVDGAAGTEIRWVSGKGWLEGVE